MKAAFTRLPLLAQTAYARLLDQLLASTAGPMADGASFVSKRIKGHTYWYVQRTDAGKKTQTYLGRETPEIVAIVDGWRRSREEAADRAELVAIARAAGLHTALAVRGSEPAANGGHAVIRSFDEIDGITGERFDRPAAGR